MRRRRHTRRSMRAAAVVARERRGAPSARSWSARRSRGRPSAARSGAGSTRSGSGPGVRRAQPGLRQSGHLSPTSAASIAADQYRSRRCRRDAGRSAGRRRRPPLLGRRERADPVDEPPAGRQHGPRGPEQLAPAARPAPRCPRGSRASGGPGGARSVPSPLHGGSSSTRSKRRGSFVLACVGARRPRRWRRPCACTSPPARGPAARGARPRRRRPVAPMRAAMSVVLPPGAAHRSSTRSPGWGSTISATSWLARDCGVNAPAA